MSTPKSDERGGDPRRSRSASASASGSALHGSVEDGWMDGWMVRFDRPDAPYVRTVRWMTVDIPGTHTHTHTHMPTHARHFTTNQPDRRDETVRRQLTGRVARDPRSRCHARVTRGLDDTHPKQQQPQNNSNNNNNNNNNDIINRERGRGRRG